MKKIILLILIFAALHATAQNDLNKDNITVKQSLKIGATKVTGISNDTSSALKRSDKLITEQAAKRYSDSSRKRIGFRFGFLVDTVNNIVDVDTAVLPGGVSAGADSAAFQSKFGSDTGRVNTYNALNLLYATKKDKNDTLNPTGYMRNWKFDSYHPTLQEVTTMSNGSNRTNDSLNIVDGSNNLLATLAREGTQGGRLWLRGGTGYAGHGLIIEPFAISWYAANGTGPLLVLDRYSIYGQSYLQLPVTGTFVPKVLAKSVNGTDADSTGNITISIPAPSPWITTAYGLTYYSGYVGIDVPAPSEKLEVDGNVKALQFLGDGSLLTGTLKQIDLDDSTMTLRTQLLDTGGNYLKSINLTNTGTLYNSTASTSYNSATHDLTITQALTSQLPYTLLARGSGAGVPSFQKIDSNWFNNTFALQVRAAQINTGGTITGVTAGMGMTGGGSSGSVTLAVDTANVNMISRQRAAATYVPLSGGTISGTINIGSSVIAAAIITASNYNCGNAGQIYFNTRSALSSAADGRLNFTTNNSTSFTRLTLGLESISFPAFTRSGADLLITDGTGSTGTSLGVGVSSVDAAAKLEVASTTKGFLPPRMTGTQRDAISSPPNGLILYNTTTDKLQVRAAGAWVDLH